MADDTDSTVSSSPEKKPLTPETRKKLVNTFRRLNGRKLYFLRDSELVERVRVSHGIDLNTSSEDHGKAVLKQVWNKHWGRG